MGDRNQVRDKTVVLRVLVPSLEARLRDKMKETEEQVVKSSRPSSTSDSTKETLMDLDGVTCEPIKDGSTLWNFHCDGANYPARLVNLPCPVELHKTHDHAMYYKSADVAQLVIVYEDQMALEEAEAVVGYKAEGFPSYYHSGLTPPLKKVVEKRFGTRDHKTGAPPSIEVSDVERELKDLIDRISKDATRTKGKAKAVTTSNKIIEEVAEEVVYYEPWMDDYGRTPYGVELDEKDSYAHPELWLDPEEVAKITMVEIEKDAAKRKKSENKKKEKAEKKKKARAEEEKEKEAANVAAPSTKKGIAKKKAKEEVDEVTQAAAQMSQMDNDDDALDMFEGMFTFDDNDDPLASAENDPLADMFA